MEDEGTMSTEAWRPRSRSPRAEQGEKRDGRPSAIMSKFSGWPEIDFHVPCSSATRICSRPAGSNSTPNFGMKVRAKSRG